MEHKPRATRLVARAHRSAGLTRSRSRRSAGRSFATSSNLVGAGASAEHRERDRFLVHIHSDGGIGHGPVPPISGDAQLVVWGSGDFMGTKERTHASSGGQPSRNF